MATSSRGIGSEGLEQGGPNLGNDYTRKDQSIRNAGDALTHPETGKLGSKENDSDNQESLDMDAESSRDLTTENSGSTMAAHTLDDDDLADLDEDDSDLDELDKGL